VRSNALDDFGRRVHGTRDDFVMGVAVGDSATYGHATACRHTHGNCYFSLISMQVVVGGMRVI